MVKEIDSNLRLHFDTSQERGEILNEIDRVSRQFDTLLGHPQIASTEKEGHIFIDIRNSIGACIPPADLDLACWSEEARRVVSTIVLTLVGENTISYSGNSKQWKLTRKRMRSWQIQSPQQRRIIWDRDHGVSGRGRISSMKGMGRLLGPKKGIRKHR